MVHFHHRAELTAIAEIRLQVALYTAGVVPFQIAAIITPLTVFHNPLPFYFYTPIRCKYIVLHPLDVSQIIYTHQVI